MQCSIGCNDIVKSFEVGSSGHGVSTLCLCDVTTCEQISQAFPPVLSDQRLEVEMGDIMYTDNAL